MNAIRSALGELCTRVFRVGVLGSAALVLVLGATAARAQTPPSIDGNLQDMIDFVNAIEGNSTGQGVVQADPTQDIGIFDPLIIPCDPVVGNYYVNGFDMNTGVFAYRPSERTVYFGIRVAGVIGDPDADDDPNTSCPATTIPEQAGIGKDDTYTLEVNFDCAGAPELIIEVTANNVVVTGAGGPSTFAFNGSDLEVAVQNVDLPVAYNLRWFAGNINDGLGEDTRTAEIRPGGPQIDVVKDANVATVCPGGFITYTIRVENPGEVPLQTVNLTDDIPAGLNYVGGSAANGCGVGAPNLVGQQLQWPAFDLDPGESCEFTFQVQRGEAACQSANFDNVATAVGSFQNACVNGGEAQTVQDSDNALVACVDAACVSVEAECSPAAACPGAPIEVTGTATNCSNAPETIVLTVAGQSEQFDNVPAGGEVSKTVTVSMPECTDGQQVSFDVSATVPGDGICPGTPEDEASCSVTCQNPQIDVEKSAESTVDIGGTIHYTITLTNPSKTVTLENIEVCDDLCSAATYAGNADPAPTSEPAIGQAGGTVCWNVASLAPGASLTFTFEAIAVGGGENCTEDVECVNTVRASGECGDAEATDSDSFTTVIPCIQEGICRFTGGGCLNEDGNNRGRKQHTFGGNVSPCPTGPPGPTGDSWEHVVREGRDILFNFHAWDPCITSCSVVPPGPCSPQAENTRADFSGPGKYSLGAGSRERDAYFEAHIIDHREGSCNRDNRDEYAITVWDEETDEIVFQFEEQEIDCGNLQIHETPRRLFGGPIVQPTPDVNGVEVALLGRPYPNPFAASMSFGYEVPSGEAQAVEIGVYNVAGRLITRLASEVQSPGRYTVRWDGRDASGVSMAPGVYFLKSKVGLTESTSRLLKIAE
jgi:uncharacterized repeat protein (TIGR01451 family)